MRGRTTSALYHGPGRPSVAETQKKQACSDDGAASDRESTLGNVQTARSQQAVFLGPVPQNHGELKTDILSTAATFSTISPEARHEDRDTMASFWFKKVRDSKVT